MIRIDVDDGNEILLNAEKLPLSPILLSPISEKNAGGDAAFDEPDVSEEFVVAFERIEFEVEILLRNPFGSSK